MERAQKECLLNDNWSIGDTSTKSRFAFAYFIEKVHVSYVAYSCLRTSQSNWLSVNVFAYALCSQPS
ncbi:Lipoprotein signal peptidase [Dissostichus eleginoides]|uniref:Lipoprotein signal peptidase n=1 Tax=Dissostichus eleginoides TaxID=100907 RepID=A0AAD9FH94_DISEL|nr:Lipoprotein signal peptidase [Dissostichus eleginoides]